MKLFSLGSAVEERKELSGDPYIVAKFCSFLRQVAGLRLLNH